MSKLADELSRGDAEFVAEVGRVRASGTLGESGRLLDLFEFLAGRGADKPSASQAEIAEMVFGQTEAGVDDATVRVYIHRLRKRLDDYYSGREDGEGGSRLTLPSGTYALRLVQAAESEQADASEKPKRPYWMLAVAAVALVALLSAFLLGREFPGRGMGPPVNDLWRPFLDSPRPKLIVVGDYYMFGEIDPVRPEQGRLIRDFRVNSASDLLQMQELEPGRYGSAEDVGLNYLPFSVSYGVSAIAPILAESGSQVSVLAASELEPDMLNYFDVVYVGLFSGMALLEDVNFMDSGLQIGETYDELIDTKTGKTYTSQEARTLASSAYYPDFGYISRFRTPGGALVAIVAGSRDTGLRGIAPIVSGAALPSGLEDAAEGGDFEALYQITGQQGADLAEKLIFTRPRTD